MPLELIQGDITTMEVDAVVNAANSRLQRGGGVCGAIFARTNGRRLQAACDRIGFCPTGEAVITPSFGLPAPFVIHAVGPVWQGGDHREAELLRSAYTRSLELAQARGLSSIAFPLISSGIYGFPKREALSIAMSAIGDWLLQSDGGMTVCLVLFDRTAFDPGDALYARIRAFIDERYVDEHVFPQYNAICEAVMPTEEADGFEGFGAPDFAESAPPEKASFSAVRRSLEDILSQARESFSQMLLRLIDERGMTDPEVYKRANLDRKLFSKIRSNAQYQPGKNTVLALSIALRLNLDQTTDLLKRAGYALSPGSKSDLIVEYFIRERQYDIFEINQTLHAFDLKPLN